MKNNYATYIKGFLICLSFFLVSVPFLWNSGRSHYDNPTCSLSTERSGSNHDLKPAYKCFYKLVDEGSIYLYSFVFIFLTTLTFELTAKNKIKTYFLFASLSIIFWFTAWSLVINMFHFAVAEKIGWYQSFTSPTSNPDPFFLFEGIAGSTPILTVFLLSCFIISLSSLFIVKLIRREP